MHRKPDEFFRINQLPPYGLGEIARAVIQGRIQGEDIVDLSQFNPDLAPPPAAVDRLVQSVLQPHNHRYSSSQGITRLRQSLASFYSRRFAVEVDVESEVVVTMGIKDALTHLMFALISTGDGVLLPTPSYPIHNAAVVLAGGRVIGIPLWSPESAAGRDQGAVPPRLTENDEWFFKRLSVAWERTWPRPLLMILSFPHNPTTAVVTPGFFTRLVELARDRGFYLVHDFAYADLAFDGYRPPSILAAPGAKQVAVECYSLSKGLSMAGWRVGFCVGNPTLVAALKKIKSYIDCGIFQPLQIAASRVLDDHEQLIQESVDTYRRRRDVLAKGLQGLGWTFQLPEASVFLWARMPEQLRVMGSLPFARALLGTARVAVCPGAGFDSRSDQWCRFALGEPEKRIRAAIERLGSFEPGAEPLSEADHGPARPETLPHHDANPLAAGAPQPAPLTNLLTPR